MYHRNRFHSISAMVLFLALLTANGFGVSVSLALPETQVINYDESWAGEGLTIAQQSQSKLELVFSLSQWTLAQEKINGRSQNTVLLPGVFLPNQAGAPNLPSISHFIALPTGATAKVRLLDFRREVYSGVEVAPAPEMPLVTDQGPLLYTPNQEIYSKDQFYPENPILVAGMEKIRGVEAAMLGITPFQYNPVSKELVVLKDIRLEISFEGGNGQYGEDRLRSIWFDPILKDIFLNSSLLPEIQDKSLVRKQAGLRTPDFEYIIISPPLPSYLAWADSLRIFRTEQGIRTGVFSTTEVGGNTPEAIESFIDDAYFNWDIPPVGVLLLGDHGSDILNVMAPNYNLYVLSDNIYADVNGNHLPDIVLSRMTAENPTHLGFMVRKVLDYESAPPLDNDYYDHPVMAGSWDSGRWNFLANETAAGYLSNELGKSPVREYAGPSNDPEIWSTHQDTPTLVQYFGPDGLGYIAQVPGPVSDWSGTADRVNADINSGAFLVQHQGHAAPYGWVLPNYVNNDVSGLHNDGLTFILSMGCSSGDFGGDIECLVETFHRHDSGALGLIGASHTSYAFVGEVFLLGMYDAIWPDFDPGHGVSGEHNFMPAFTNASGKYYLQASSWPWNYGKKNLTYHLFHHHGDAFSTVFTQMPQNLEVTHDSSLTSGVEYFNVIADAGSLIGLCVDGALWSSVISDGGTHTFNIPAQMVGSQLVVTVTKQNHLRYRREIPVLPAPGCFVIFNDLEINDSTGNNNGVWDFTEDVTLSINLHNVGLGTADEVTAVISSDDPMVTILDDAAFYGEIPAGEMLSVTDGFRVLLAAEVSHGHQVAFSLVATSGDSSQTSSFVIEAHAPSLIVSGATLVGDNDGDGVLDPGESGTLQIALSNQGTNAATNLSVGLACVESGIGVESTDYPIRVLAPGDTAELQFKISTSSGIAVGDVILVSVLAHGDHYNFNGGFQLTIGQYMEDFESGTLSNYPWVTEGLVRWEISTLEPAGGSYCVKSGSAFGDANELVLELNVLTPSSVSFMAKIWTTHSNNGLKFYVDDVEMGFWNEEAPWFDISIPVDPGTHFLRWVYVRNLGSFESNVCWVDNIVFPDSRTPVPPSLGINLESLDAVVVQPELEIHTVPISNNGEALLECFASVAMDEPRQTEVPQLDLAHGQDDPRTPLVPARGSGGPDAFWYYWTDSDEVDGPQYQWIEINDVGTVAGSGVDANLGPFALGFEFPYYGVIHQEVRICTNGWLSFTSTVNNYTNNGIPSGAAPNNLVAPFWDDFNSDAGGAIYYYADTENDRFIVEFDEVPLYNGEAEETFQVIFNADGSIVYQYKIAEQAEGCTVGIEGPSGANGLQVAFNEEYLHNEMAIRFESSPPLVPWLSVSSDPITLGQGQRSEFEVTFNTVDADLGVYSGSIILQTNDPQQLVVSIPVSLTVVDPLSRSSAPELPMVYALEAAYPNPFNPATTIKYSTPGSGRVSLKIYDLAGRLVRTLVDEKKPGGVHSALWNGQDNFQRGVASGAYYYRLKAEGFDQTQKMLLIK